MAANHQIYQTRSHVGIARWIHESQQQQYGDLFYFLNTQNLDIEALANAGLLENPHQLEQFLLEQ